MEWKNSDGSLTGGVVIEDGAGNKLGTAANPLNVIGGGSGGGGGSNASVGATGSAAPADATAIGYQNGSGNLMIPSASAGLPIVEGAGAPITGAIMPIGGVGMTGWLSAIWSKLAAGLTVSWSGQSVSVSNLPATQVVSATSLPLPTGAAQDGTDATGVSQMSGGVGVRGWLSGIYSKLSNALAVTWSGSPNVTVANSSLAVTGSFYQATQPISGAVSVSNLPTTQAVSLIDGADATLGAKADAIATVASGSPGSFSLIALSKQIAVAVAGYLNVNLSIGGATVSSSNAVPIYDGFAAPVTTTFNSGSAANAALTVTTTGMDTVVLTAIPSGSMTAGALTFEVYDGANWLPIKGARPESYYTDQSLSLVGAVSRAWQFSVAGFPQFRVRLSTAISGSGSCLTTAVVSSAPSTPELTVGLDPNQPLPAGSNTLGSVSVSNFPGTQAVSIASMPSTPVTGTFWQSTQPVSLASLPSLAASTNIAGYMGSLNFGPLVTIPTIQAAAYASGNNIGGKQTVSFFRNTTQPSATLSQFMLGWAGVETTPITVYIFSKNPAGSTFTDKGAFTLAAADAQYLVTPPFTLTAAAATGSTQTFASQSLSLSVKNQDTSVSTNLYVALAIGGAVTPAVGDLFFSIYGVQD